MTRVWDVPVEDAAGVSAARSAAEEAAALAGLDAPRGADAVTVASELAANLVEHAGGGRLLVEAVPPVRPAGAHDAPVVQIAAVDHGPGTAETPAGRDFGTDGATGTPRDGHPAVRTLGSGLRVCHRVADSFALHAAPGRGTAAVARIGAAPVLPAQSAGPDAVRTGGINVPLGGAALSGDAWTAVRAGHLVTLMLADGLGHGPEAARASTAAVEALREVPELAPAAALRHLGEALRGTRGAAVALARLDTRTGRLLFAGLGNVGARLYTGGSWRTLLSRPGIVGVHRRAAPPETDLAWAPDAVLVLHSDGLPQRWTPPAGLRPPAVDPAVFCAVTVRDTFGPAAQVRDDTAVAALTTTPPDLS
ncbi:SpoIIE family protein phosphatase [Streptomyces sp. NPDC008150]|uniref:SpoIIE family protein phosphatase n=1 Tax=Streptomyces sp. NPDC008150 TaxID=3364816 RepID=UPI0036E62277